MYSKRQYRRAPKHTLLYCTLLRGKSGEVAFGRIFILPHKHILSLFLAIFNTHEVDNPNDCHGILKEAAGSMNVYIRKSAALGLVLRKPRGIEATCIVSGDRVQPYISFLSQRGYNDFVYIHVFDNDGAKLKAS